MAAYGETHETVAQSAQLLSLLLQSEGDFDFFSSTPYLFLFLSSCSRLSTAPPRTSCLRT